MNHADESQQQPQRITTELRAIKRSGGSWDLEDAAHGNEAHTLLLSVVGPKRVAAPGLLTHEAFSTWIVAMRDEGFDITLSDLHGNPAHLEE